MKTAIINFKTYPKGTGKNAVALARICSSVAKRFKNVRVILAVQAADIYQMSRAVKLLVIAQHVDPIGFGSHTGHILLDSVVANGARGSLINHSEFRLNESSIKIVIGLLKKKRMQSILCVKDVAEARKYAKYKPSLIAVEPPKLIGGNVSVSQAKPDLISNAVKAVSIPILVGAGIHSTEDVSKAIALGAEGILVASNILKSSNPRKELTNLLNGFNRS